MPLEQLKQLSVIYAEDDEFTRMLYAGMLESLVPDLRLAENGLAAEQLFLERPCDLLITDLEMPGMDGLQLCRALRVLEPELPVVIISSHDQGDLLLQTADLGVDGYLLKPLDGENLGRTLLRAAERLIARRTVEQAARYWRYTFDAIPDLITVLDQHYRIVNMNQAALQELGCSLEQAIGRDYCAILHPTGLLPAECCHSRQLHTCCMKSGDEPVAMLGGYYHVTVTPICDDQGRETGSAHVARDVTDKTEAEQTLRYISTHDQLTGVFNRAWFEAEFQRLQCGRTWPVSLIVTDLDGLKLVNDSHGHAAGDELIRRAVGVLKQTCRSDEMISRVGGDEFVILLPGIDESEASAIVNRINVRMSEDTGLPRLSMSLGTATAGRADQLCQALSRADQRMYRDKANRKAARLAESVSEGGTDV